MIIIQEKPKSVVVAINVGDDTDFSDMENILKEFFIRYRYKEIENMTILQSSSKYLYNEIREIIQDKLKYFK